MLKNIFSTIILTCLFLSACFAEDFDLHQNLFDGIEQQSIPKNYISSSQILFIDEKIFIQTDKGLFEAVSLRSDETGIFSRREHPKAWKCRRCGYENRYTWYCEECGSSEPVSEDVASDPHKYSYPPKKRKRR